MIKKIQVLKNFGVYKNFSWSIDLPEFKEKNIIYGWNYTGKTTLSRIFSSLKNKELHPKFLSGEFKLVLDDKSEIKESDLSNCLLSVEVFNSEYIKENLRWETDENLNGISFDVGENVKTREQIEFNQERINSIIGTDVIIGRTKPYLETTQKFNIYESTKFSEESKRIKNDVFNSLIEFDKRHFGKVKTEVAKNPKSFIIKDDAELKKLKKVCLASKDRLPLQLIEYKPASLDLYNEVKTILLSEPPKSKIVEILDKDKNLYDWAKAGLLLHQDMSKCSFCDGDLNTLRLSELNNYFSNEASQLKNSITSLKGRILAEKALFENISIPSSKNDFFENYQDEYQIELEKLSDLNNRYNKFLDDLLNELSRKETKDIFNSIIIKDVDAEIYNDVLNWLTSINNIINEHNTFIDNFDKEQESSRNKLKQHQIDNYLNDEKYFDLENEKNHADRCLGRYKKLVDALRKENKKLEGELKSIIAGRNELNDFIVKILNRNDISIEVTADDKFVLKRGELIAENLSEGEKTAISFAYFLVSLESKHRDKKLKDCVIFIDDPISSLDGNHIAQIYSLINSFFFRQNEDPNEPNKFVNCFKQLFISTHNFEFFSFLKDSNRINKKGTREYYFVKRNLNDESEIQNLPKSLRDYKSEYIYLFDIIYKFYEAGCQESDNKLILMPNAVRRFLEIYTLLRLPDSNDEVDARLRILMPEPHQLKLLHHFSHFTTFEKITRHDELLMNLPAAIGELITLLNTDNNHFESLKRAIA